MPLPYCTYILQSLRDGNLYVGCTTDLDQRLAAHNGGSVQSTAPRRPLRLIFCEHYISQDDAFRREKYLKSAAGKRALKIMLSDTLNSEAVPLTRRC